MVFLLSTMAQKDTRQKHIHEVKVQIHLKELITFTFLINCKKKREGRGREERGGGGEKRGRKKMRKKLS